MNKKEAEERTAVDIMVRACRRIVALAENDEPARMKMADIGRIARAAMREVAR